MYLEVSNFGESVDRIFLAIFGIGIFFLVGITFTMLIFIKKYRRSVHPKAQQVREYLGVELLWTGIPLVLVLLMFYFGYEVYMPMTSPPDDAMVVKTYGKMWEWSFEYDNGKTSKELVVPINKAVKLDLISLDVIHGFFVPSFRIKEDVVPGKKNFVWFIPKEYGDYKIMCTSYCGLKHSFMSSDVVVVTQDRFKTWLDSLPEKINEPEGLTLIKNNACTGCHTIDGSKGVGPTFYKLFNSRVTVEGDDEEKEIVADEIYLRRSIIEPNTDIVKGYQKGIMKSYRGVIKNDDIKKIIEYFKTLK